MVTQFLAGIRVLELARILAGPWAGQLLADFGADVVKVERKGAGDDTRQWGPPFVPAADGGNLGAAYFHSCNRGKRSIEADFDTAEGQALIRSLAASADVVIENFKVGGLKKFGLDYESLKAVNPKLIYCSITGFGQTGPYAPRAGYDFLIQGMAGPMSVTGAPDGPPTKAGYATADIFTGMYAGVSILAALRRRDLTGEGAHIDCALLDTQIAVLGNQAMNYLYSGQSPRKLGNSHPNIVPYDVFEVADGHIIIACGNDGQFQKLCQVLKAPEIAGHADYATNEGRVTHRIELMAALSNCTSAWAKHDILAALEAAGVPGGPINTLSEVFADPQVRERAMRIDLPAPAAMEGGIASVRMPVLIDGAPVVSDRPSPSLGADTQGVLSDPAWNGRSI